MLDGPMAPVLAPVAKVGLGRLLREDRDLEADRQAVRLTRYPPGLHAALAKIGEGDAKPMSSTPGQAHLWLVDPSAESAAVLSAEDEVHRAPLGLRIDVLAEL